MFIFYKIYGIICLKWVRMVRVKDLRAYFLILIFFLMCFLGISALYQFGITNIVNDNALSQTRSYLEASESDIYASIESYKSLFFKGDSSVEATAVTSPTIFGENDYVISSAAEAEGVNGDYYVYFKDGSSYGKIKLASVLSKALSTDKNVIIVTNGDGKYIGSNVGYKVSTLIEILAETNSTDVTNKVVSKAKSREVYQTKASIITSDGSKAKGYIAVGEFEGLGLVRFVDSSLIVQSKDISSLRLAYIAGLAIIVIGICVTIGLMMRKCKNTASSDPGVSLRGSNIVIVAKANGKLVNYNKAFRISFPNHDVPITSLAELEVVDSEFGIDILIKDQKHFRLCYRGVVNEEGVKDHDDIYFDFFSLKRTSDYSIVGRECTAEYEHEQVLITTSTKSSVTGDDNSVVFAKDYNIVKEKYKNVADPYTVLMVDLMGFKDVNTLLGWDQGNEVLIYFSKLLRETFQELSVYHIQGDEFVLLDKTGNEAAVLQVVDQLLESLKAPILINNNEIKLRPAIGVLDSDMDGLTEDDADAAISKLMIATEKAKGTAGKSVCKYDVNLANAAAKDREMEEDLKQAIAKGEFVMFYQPQYEINQERVCGFEALLRWNNPKYASISPEVYIKMAERNGFIIDVGNFINSDVFKTAKEMEQYDIHISVNVSPAQIVQAGFVADFLDKFEKNDLRPGAIALEVTETFLMENFNSVIEKLQILKNRGISIHLDDFGTGYSSMLYLKELPIDTIKVDKEFIKHIETDRFSKVLTSKIITLAKELGDKVICEGVETKVQKDIVGKFGADIIQGYYIGKALSKEDAFALLKTGKVSSENKTSGRSSE